MRAWRIVSVAVLLVASVAVVLQTGPEPGASVGGGEGLADRSARDASASLGGVQGVADPAVEALEDVLGVVEDGVGNGTSGDARGRPDLQVAWVRPSPEAPVAGQVVHVDAGLVNAGDAPAGNFTATIAVEHEDGGHTVLVRTFFSGLPSGGNTTFPSESWEAVAGNHTLVVTVDAGGSVNESREDNNRHEHLLRVGGWPGELPDLAVHYVEPVGAPVAGEDVTFRVGVINVGAVDAPAFTVEVRVDGEAVAHQYFSGLPAHESREFLSEPAWRGGTGTHEVRVVVDPGSEVLERDEGNNWGWRRFEVTAGPSPDLEAAAINLEPTASPVEGEEVRFRVHYWNRGSAPAENFTVTLRLEEWSGRLVAEHSLLVSSLGAGEKGSFVTDDWYARAGRYSVLLTVDDGDGVPEHEERNNQLREGFRVGGPEDPDLVLTQLSHRRSWQDGSFSFHVNVTNRGGADAGPFTFEVRVDGELVSRHHVEGLAAGEVLSVWTEPGWSGESGEHVVDVYVDAGQQVEEWDERNNAMEQAFQS